MTVVLMQFGLKVERGFLIVLIGAQVKLFLFLIMKLPHILQLATALHLILILVALTLVTMLHIPVQFIYSNTNNLILI